VTRLRGRLVSALLAVVVGVVTAGAQDTAPVPERGGVRFVIGGLVEIAAVAVNAHRKPGGNETSFGDFAGLLTLRAKVAPTAPRRLQAAGLDVAWIPGQGALDYADPARRNEQNQNWLRADGTFNQPELVVSLWATLRAGRSQRLRLRLGGFLASGLEPLDGAPSVHYLTLPAPLLLAEHWDKGLEARWDPNEAVAVKAAVLDGDWATGEPSLMRLHNSAANSYPSYAAGVTMRPLRFRKGRAPRARRGTVVLGWDATWGQLGSTWPPGNLYEKRRQDDVTLYVAATLGVGATEIEARAFRIRLARNPLGTGAGTHDRAVTTTGEGLEAVWRGVRIAGARLDLYAHAWRLHNRTGVPDGEVWPGENGLDARFIDGWMAGMKWVEPVAVGDGIGSYLGLAWGGIRPDVPDAFGSSHHLRALFRVVAGVRR
jgi:hypothetical protein